MMQTVPLNKLEISLVNVRKTDCDFEIASLADSIAAVGLLKNLVVTETQRGKRWVVDAGGRRFRALRLLVERGTIAENFPVPVMVIDKSAAREASLAENVQRAVMNPADEAEAFRALFNDADRDDPDRSDFVSPAEIIANIAQRFGITPRKVEQRLRLAALHPDILAALRDRTLTIDAASAYASHPDQEIQRAVFETQLKLSTTGHPQHQPKNIRAALDGKIYHADDRAVRYITLDAYTAAGGRIASDLFFGEDERDQLLDPALVDRLAMQKASAEAQYLAQCDGYLDAFVKHWAAPLWQDPKPPKGFGLTYRNPEMVEPEIRATALVAYEIAPDGSGLQRLSRVALPLEPAASDNAKVPPVSSQEQQDAYRAREHRARVELRAARLAIPAIDATPLDGRTFWPAPGAQWINAIEYEEDGSTLIAVQIRVSAEEIAARAAEAEALITAEDAERLAAEQAAEAASEEAEASAADDANVADATVANAHDREAETA